MKTKLAIAAAAALFTNNVNAQVPIAPEQNLFYSSQGWAAGNFTELDWRGNPSATYIHARISFDVYPHNGGLVWGATWQYYVDLGVWDTTVTIDFVTLNNIPGGLWHQNYRPFKFEVWSPWSRQWYYASPGKPNNNEPSATYMLVNYNGFRYINMIWAGANGASPYASASACEAVVNQNFPL